MAESEQLKVFVSYSRADAGIADEIVAGLEFAERFDVFIDRDAIHEGEAWQSRLQHLIETSDAIVFLLSPHSASSKVCHWEVEMAASLSKRIIPVLLQTPGEADAPAALSQLNYVRLDEGRSFMEGLAGLRRALLTDLDWLREHTRLQQRAAEWDTAGRSEERLLIGEDITHAKTWLQSVPPDVPGPTQLHRAFIAASEAGAELRLSAERERAEELSRSIKRTMRALALSIGLAITSMTVSGVAWYFWRDAQFSKVAAEQSAQEAKVLASELAEQLESIRRARNMRIQVETGDDNLHELGGNWFEMLNTYQNSVATITFSGADGLATLADGVIIDGGALHQSLQGEPILAVSGYAAFPWRRGNRDGADLKFPLAVGLDQQAFEIGEFLWETSATNGIVFLRVKSKLPDKIVRVTEISGINWPATIFSDPPQQNRFEQRYLGQDYGSALTNKLLISYAFLDSPKPSFVVTRLGGIRIGSDTPKRGSLPSYSEMSNLPLESYSRLWTPDWIMNERSGSAPMFDADRGELVCINTGIFRTPVNGTYTPFNTCTLIAPFIEAAREDLAKEFALKKSDNTPEKGETHSAQP